jgi:anaerobic selenocysteine-containing dehydrogenase
VPARLDALADAGRTSALAWLTKPRQSTRDELVALFLDRFGAPAPIRVSLLDDDVLRRANGISFGRDQLPTFDLAHAQFVIGFGADFLGTWNSPVAQGAAYGAMRQGTRGRRGSFVQIESRMSQTGANADMWVPTRPGTEGALALGMAHVIINERLAEPTAARRAGGAVDSWTAGLPQFTPDAVERITGVPAARIESLARSFAQSARAVAIIGGPALAQTNALSQALAVNALNALVGSVDVPGGVQFTPTLPRQPDIRQRSTRVRPSEQAGDERSRNVATFASEILSSATSPVEVVLLDDANPVFLSPQSWRVREALARVPFIASFGSFIDETSILADLILPDHSFLESWVDAIPESGTTVAAAAVASPAMRPLYSTRSTPDVLLDVARRVRRPLAPPLPWQQFDEMLRERFAALPVGADVPDAWAAAQERGGWWPSAPPSLERAQIAPEEGRRSAGGTEVVPWTDPQFDGEAGEFPLHFLPYASTAFYDGSTAHLPWMQEMPDPLTSAMWSNWIEVNPTTAARLQIAMHDMVEITSQHGSVRAPVVVTPGIAPDVVAMPIGQGHESFTRYASKRGSNPLAILAPIAEPATGALAWAATRVRLSRVSEGRGELILFAGSADEHPHEHR